MKILIITAYGGWGSTGRIADSIAKESEKQGHTAYVAYGFYRSAYPNSLKLKHGARYGSFFEIFRCRLTGYMGFTSKAATKKLIKWINEIKPDVINLHNAHGGYIHIEMLFDYLKSCGIPVVWTMHDCWSFTGHCAHFEKIGCEKWKTGCSECQDQRMKQCYPISYFFDRSAEQYKRKKSAFMDVSRLTIVTPSQWLADLVRQSYMGYADVKVIHNGIDVDIFQPLEPEEAKRYECKDGRKTVLAVSATWGERKGYKYVLELAKRLPKDEYRVIIVGLNERQLEVLPEGIIGISRTASQQELADLYSSADVLVNTTLEDTYPTVNLESIACGTPVVTFRTGGSPESITSETGSVVEQHDVDALEREVIRWASIEAEEACREYAVNNFSSESCFQKYISLFEEVSHG